MRGHRAVALVRWLLVVVLLLLGAAAAWQGTLRWLRPQVTVTRVVEGPVVQAFYATGTLLPEREYPIKANNPGSITSVLVDKGDKVKKDQPLAIVAEDGVQYRFDQAKAERDLKAKLADEWQSPVLRDFDARLAASSELLDIAQREQKRMSAAAEKNAASQSDVDRALDRVKTLVSEMESMRAQRAAKKLEADKDLVVAEAALKIARWNLDRQTIRSPVDGVVLDRPLTVGTRLAVNDHIMQVADVRPEMLIMRAAVDEEDKTLAHVGQAVWMTLYAFPDRVFEGKVKRIYDKADADRRTFEIDVATLEKNPAFAAGMTGELAFIIAAKDKALIVPSQAVQGGNVWTVRDGRLAKNQPKIGLRSVERAEILSGLQLNDVVVISPAGDLREGQSVRSGYTDPVQAAGQNKPTTTENPFRGFN